MYIFFHYIPVLASIVVKLLCVKKHTQKTTTENQLYECFNYHRSSTSHIYRLYANQFIVHFEYSKTSKSVVKSVKKTSSIPNRISDGMILVNI